MLKCQIFDALVATIGGTLQYGHALGKQTGNNTLILIIKTDSQNGIMIAYQHISAAVTGLGLVFFEGKRLAGQIGLQLAGGRIDHVAAGLAAESCRT